MRGIYRALFALPCVMKKIVRILILIIVSSGIFFFFTYSESQKATLNTTTSQEASRQDASETTESTTYSGETVPASPPSRIMIPAIGVETAIESVGMNEKGEMAVPQEDMNVAWYNLGYKPGENGSAVIAGHFDTKTGDPAVFYNLNGLRDGDKIIITYPNGKDYTFLVTDSALYPYNNFPLERVFNTKGEATLNLITCDGVFDTASRTYSQRRVVFATLNND